MEYSQEYYVLNQALLSWLKTSKAHLELTLVTPLTKAYLVWFLIWSDGQLQRRILLVSDCLHFTMIEPNVQSLEMVSNPRQYLFVLTQFIDV